ncbi:MAG: Hsp20/alpha crystallin family protein [Chloroflexi bacterium]|nr:Hsp20/alpha crystallin family protein [Chloroflexota bacterium]
MSSLLSKDYQTELSFSGRHAIGWQVSIHSYAWSPPTDVYETDAGFIDRLEVAGMRQSDFSIDRENNFLVISGVRSESPERRTYQQMEIRFGEFSTAIEIPAGADVSKAQADYEDGFLNVVMPKIKPTTINIKG